MKGDSMVRGQRAMAFYIISGVLVGSVLGVGRESIAAPGPEMPPTVKATVTVEAGSTAETTPTATPEQTAVPEATPAGDTEEDDGETSPCGKLNENEYEALSKRLLAMSSLTKFFIQSGDNIDIGASSEVWVWVYHEAVKENYAKVHIRSDGQEAEVTVSVDSNYFPTYPPMGLNGQATYQLVCLDKSWKFKEVRWSGASIQAKRNPKPRSRPKINKDNYEHFTVDGYIGLVNGGPSLRINGAGNSADNLVNEIDRWSMSTNTKKSLKVDNAGAREEISVKEVKTFGDPPPPDQPWGLEISSDFRFEQVFDNSKAALLGVIRLILGNDRFLGENTAQSLVIPDRPVNKAIYQYESVKEDFIINKVSPRQRKFCKFMRGRIIFDPNQSVSADKSRSEKLVIVKDLLLDLSFSPADSPVDVVMSKVLQRDYKLVSEKVMSYKAVHGIKNLELFFDDTLQVTSDSKSATVLKINEQLPNYPIEVDNLQAFSAAYANTVAALKGDGWFAYTGSLPDTFQPVNRLIALRSGWPATGPTLN
jgi:hypothetical protein